jgi:tRNA(Ile)-lysidine synthase
MNLLEAFQQVLLKYELVERNDKILIAVSGGVDSTVLLDLFSHVKEKFALELQVIHINHGLRGSESNSDADFVMEFARRYHLQCSQKSVDTRTYAISSKLSIEESARILRYRFFDDMLRATHFNKVATAHNADDQAETILDHLMRGSGIRGLAGIAMERDHYIRPLLNFSRHDIEHYASENKIKYRIDSSNWELKYKRNRIRHELIPYIKRQFNPKISQVLLRSGEIFRETENYLMSQAAEALQNCLRSTKSNEIVLHLPPFLSTISIIQQYIIFNILEKLGVQKNLVRYQSMDRILKLAQEGKSGNRVQIGEDWEAVISRDEFVFHQRVLENFTLEVKVDETYFLFRGEVTFRTEIVEPSEKIPEFSTNPTVEYIDFDKIALPLYLRNPQKGDKFRPLNMRGEKKLSDFFIDEKVPNYLRGRVPVLECRDGIIWVCGYRIDDRYKISKNTKQILRIEICEGCYDRVPPERF